jgi:hypothetical protein
VRSWLPWWLVPVAVAGWIVAHRATGAELLEDTDTRVLLAKLDERDAPFSWFLTDWPLENHFYRPVSTLTFELDRWLHGGGAPGYGLTNAVLAGLVVLAAFWLVREASGRPWLAAGTSLLLGVWHLGTGLPEALAGGLQWAGFLVWAGLLRGRRNLGPVAVASGTLFFLSWAVPALVPLGGRVVGWLPGRTASTMTLFLVLGLAASARWTRLAGPLREEAPAMATDIPATKGTPPPVPSRRAWLLLVAAAVSWLLAFGCYEQAVAVVPLSLALSAVMAGQGRRYSWLAPGLAMGALAVYVAVRVAVVPSEPSRYHLQQFRDGPGVVLSLLDYALPGANALRLAAAYADAGLSALFIPTWWGAVGLAAGTAAAIVAGLRGDGPPGRLWPWAMALLAYAPMACLKFFEHYHLLPAVFRAWGVVALLGTALRAALSAVGPPAVAAPRRPGSAPGSLLRP